MHQAVTSDVVRKTIVVPRTPEEAFALFTAGIGSWWPTDTHAIRADRDVVFEEHAGGEVYEIGADGERGHWATVLLWDAPNRFVLEWKVNPNAVAATELEVRFERAGEGTRVELEHRGWERLGEGARAAYEDYDGGWDHVLGRYEAAARP